jgi:hypothetical protein
MEAGAILRFMQSVPRRHSKWRRFNRKYGSFVVLSILVLFVLGAIALMIVLMNKPARYNGNTDFSF